VQYIKKAIRVEIEGGHNREKINYRANKLLHHEEEMI